MPLPKHTPVASRSARFVGVQPASCRASCVAAIAYCVYFAIRLAWPWSNHSPASHPPSFLLPNGTIPATWDGRSVYAVAESEEGGGSDEVLTIPEWLCNSRDQVSLMPTPKGVMAPKPVTTTRLMIVVAWCCDENWLNFETRIIDLRLWLTCGACFSDVWRSSIRLV